MAQIKLVKVVNGNIEKIMSDNEAMFINKNQYDNWINGLGITKIFSNNIIKEYKGSQEIRIDHTTKKIIGDKNDIIWMTFSDRKSKYEYLFIDIDFKAMLCSDTDKEQFKDDLIDLVKSDDNLNSKIYRIVKSGDNPNNGIHIIIRGKSLNNNIKSKIIDDLIKYLHINLSIENKGTNLYDKGVVDKSSLTKMRWMKIRFGCGFEYENDEAYWPIEGTNPISLFNDLKLNKLIVPDEYTSNFHNELFRYLSLSSLSLQETLDLYKNELNNKPFKDRNKTFGDEINRLFKYVKQINITNNKISYLDLCYLDDKGSYKVDDDKVYKWINDNFDISYKNGLHFVKEKSKLDWYYFDENRTLKRFEIINYFNDKLGINDISIRSMFNKSYTTILKNMNYIPHKNIRDYDTKDSIYLRIDTISGVKHIKITKDTAEWVDIEYLANVDNTNKQVIPFDNLDLNTDYHDWDVYKKGFFHNITNNYPLLKRIIGYSLHMSLSTINGVRMIVLTDSANDDNKQAGVGKTVLANMITFFRNSQIINSFKSGEFALQGIKPHHQMLHIDELPMNTDMDDFRKLSSTKLDINAKYKEVFYMDQVKTIICSNYLMDRNKANEDRRIEVQFKRFYERTSNNLQSHLGYRILNTKDFYQSKPSFVTELGNTIDIKKWWEGYISFFINCCQVYLKDVNKYIPNLVELGSKEKKQIDIWLKNPITEELYTNVVDHIEKVIKTNEEEYLFFNDNFTGVYTNTGHLAKIPYMIENYLIIANNGYEYVESKLDDRNRKKVHKIKKKIKDGII